MLGLFSWQTVSVKCFERKKVKYIAYDSWRKCVIGHYGQLTDWLIDLMASLKLERTTGHNKLQWETNEWQKAETAEPASQSVSPVVTNEKCHRAIAEGHAMTYRTGLCS